MKVAIKATEFDWDLDVEDFSAIKLLVHYFYHHDYPSELPTHADHNGMAAENLAKGLLAVHSKMYAMGEKYQVPALKALALRKFKTQWYNTNAGLSTAIVIAFMSTPETDRGLRDAIIEIFGTHTWLEIFDVMDETIKEIPELVYALYRKALTKLHTR
jgi:hypothetical protein